jgi:hypothetical protein
MLTRSGKKITSDQWKLENRKRYIPLSATSPETCMLSIEFDKLPLDIYYIIQGYLPHYDYRCLLNCNKSMFSPIKYETCFYKFIPFHQWTSKTSSLDYYEQVPEFCKEFVQFNIKDKSKQVEMSIEYTTKANFLLFQDLINGIFRLSINFENAATARIPRLMFQNIYQLELRDIGGLTTLDPLEFMNIHSLSIFDAPSLVDITALRKLVTLKEVELSSCRNLVDISSIQDVPSVTVFACWQVADISMFGSQEEVFDFRSPSNPALITPFLYQFEKTKRLAVVGALRMDFCESLFEMKAITNLSLFNESPDRLTLPFCFSNIVEMRLKNFDLSSWKPVLAKLKTAELDNCVISDYTPFIFAKDLILDYSSIHESDIDLTKFLKLKYLSFGDCDKLQQISCPSTLIHLCILACPEVTKITDMTSVKYVTITDCDKLATLDCSGMQAKSVTLDNLPNLTDFSCVIDVPEVEITRCDSFVDCTVLRNAEDVFIKKCCAVSDVSDLGNVKRLNIRKCSNVVSLKGLGNVEELSVTCCPLESLVGLENNQVVIIEGVSRSLYEDYEYGPYSHLKEKIPQIKVIPNSAVYFRSFLLNLFM